MRATRAYFAGMGTTGLLVLAAVTVLVAVSALLAFNGWPGDGTAGRATPVMIDPGSQAAAQTGPARVAAAAAEAADEVAFAAEAPRRTGDAPAGGPLRDVPRGDGDPGADPLPAPRPEDPFAPAPNGDNDARPPERGGIELPGGSTLLGGGSGPSPTDGVADAVESTAAFAGDALAAELSPQLGMLVTDTGQALTDLVRGLDGAPAGRR